MTTKTTTLLERAPFDELLDNPGPLFRTALEAHRTATPPAVQDHDRYGGTPKPPAGPFLHLSARHPYDVNGLIDSYHPGRWDASSDTLYMSPIVQTGPSPGEWDGTVVYGQFTVVDAGTYQVTATFYGYQITMQLNGPWGSVVAGSVDNIPATLTGQVVATAGQHLWFTMSCTGLYLGFLQGIDVVKL